jgi:hypothetical protein
MARSRSITVDWVVFLTIMKEVLINIGIFVVVFVVGLFVQSLF